ncbi:MAG: polysaccharide pyruvyl transferase family protein [bacterium]
MHIQIHDYLRELAADQDIVYCPNGGNAGDAMIASATYDLFAETGVSFSLFDPEHFDPKGKTLIYGGGGNLIPLYQSAHKFIERYHRAVRRLIVLPHTIQGHEDLLADLGTNVDLLTREAVSYDYVKRVTSGPRVFLADDLALSLSSAAYLGQQEGWLRMICRQENSVYRKAKWSVILAREYCRRRCAPASSEVLRAFRIDKERTRNTLPRGNVDVSRLLKCKNLSPLQAACTTQMLLRFINNYQEVQTDRLHVAIAAALLGKQVKMYANSTYKCEAVYQCSLAGRFPQIQWMGGENEFQA